MKKYLLLSLFIISPSFCFSQKLVKSRLYNDNGYLIADTTFKIPPRLLKKFKLIETQLTDSFLKIVKYSAVLRENEVSFEVILSFSIDDHGIFSNVSTAKSSAIISGKYELLNPSFSNDLSIFLMHSSGLLSKEGFKAKKNKYDKFYLPIKFELDKIQTCTDIQAGWLVKIEKSWPKDLNSRPVE